MYLKLAVGGTIIAALPLRRDKAVSLEYIYEQRWLLADACMHFITTQKDAPEFYLEIPSRMNSLANE